MRRSTDLPLNIHLMVQEPDNLLAGFAKSGTDQVIVHAEASTHLHRTVYHVKELGCQVGVALNPATPISVVEELLPFLDIALVMTVNPALAASPLSPAPWVKSGGCGVWSKNWGVRPGLR